MTYQKIKEIIVDERKVITEKKLKGLTRRLTLFIVGLCACLGLAVSNILGFGAVVVVTLGGVFLYSTMFDLCAESDGALKAVNVCSRFWIIFPILFVVIYCVLKYFNFS